MKDDDKQQRGNPGPAQASSPPLSEWIVAAIGLALLLAALGYLVQQALADRGAPPDPRAQLLRVEPQSGRFLAILQVRNASAATAAALRVSGVLRQQGQEVERAETDFQFLPGHSSREAGLFFTRDPRQLQLELKVVSYQQP